MGNNGVIGFIIITFFFRYSNFGGKCVQFAFKANKWSL